MEDYSKSNLLNGLNCIKLYIKVTTKVLINIFGKFKMENLDIYRKFQKSNPLENILGKFLIKRN
jgi:hypothetical protein